MALLQRVIQIACLSLLISDFYVTAEYDLHRAAENDDLEAAKKFIKDGANIEEKDYYGKTPLHWAADKNSLEVAKYLIDNGANKNAKNVAGETPLHMAALSDSLGVAKVLIKGTKCDNSGRKHLWALCGGADIEARTNPSPVPGANTPLHEAAVKDSLKVAKLLINQGADLEAKNSAFKNPINLAKSPEMKKLLQEAYKAWRKLLKNSSAKFGPSSPLHAIVQSMVCVLFLGLF